MNLLDVAINTLGGLGLFILGMKLMTEGLQMSAGKRIKGILEAVSSNRVVGCATGAFVTALVQSSSATTVMLIGFVSAGLMTLQQAIGVILGANVGTTMTAQLIAFKLSALALPAIIIGVPLKFFASRKKVRYIGEVILGFGLLFFGMTVMKHGLSPIKSDPAFATFFTQFSPETMGGLLLCVGVGALVTIMVQSSSATIGLTMTLAVQGLIDFPTAMALVLGENIGTTITAELATIGSSNLNAHRTARAHTMFNVLGVGMMLLFFPYFIDLVETLSAYFGAAPVTSTVDGEYVNVGRYIANGHTMFNIVNALFFLAVLPWLIKVAVLLSPAEKKEDRLRPPSFDGRIIESPVGALAEARGEIARMAEGVRETLDNTLECLRSGDHRKIRRWRRYEEHINLMHKEILAYLTRIYQGEVNEDISREISGLMRVTNNLERIGDAVQSIALQVEDISEGSVTLSQQSRADVEELGAIVRWFMDLVTEAVNSTPQNLLDEAENLENTIDLTRETMRQAHIVRLREGTCSIESGMAFVNIITRLERCGDYCFSISKVLTAN
ncbi:MAG TPA: Na/Pi cotransporter family protein [Desulfomicrobiaceae bacterium]|nr:Na/Pi cotransporter family protein [Desulfomicrobiaceae bacterium]